MAEMIFSSVVLLVSASPIIILGFVQYRSKEPVGFWAGKKPPRKEEITDVGAYNRKHGLMWILYGLGLIVYHIFEILEAFYSNLFQNYLSLRNISFPHFL